MRNSGTTELDWFIHIVFSLPIVVKTELLIQNSLLILCIILIDWNHVLDERSIILCFYVHTTIKQENNASMHPYIYGDSNLGPSVPVVHNRSSLKLSNLIIIKMYRFSEFFGLFHRPVL
jgi:hypothetical protein